MNVELLLKVKAAILAQPERYDQNNFCGTPCCIAGWVLTIANPDLDRKRRSLHLGEETWNDLWESARLNAGITTRQMAMLCACADDWSPKFAQQYDSAEDASGRAVAGAARIDHFIANGGAQ